MLAKVTPKKTTEQDVVARPKGQQRPAEERYRLRVDGQHKRSFNSKDAAVTAGQAIKKAFPVVEVVVVDADTGDREVLAA